MDGQDWILCKAPLVTSKYSQGCLSNKIGIPTFFYVMAHIELVIYKAHVINWRIMVVSWYMERWGLVLENIFTLIHNCNVKFKKVINDYKFTIYIKLSKLFSQIIKQDSVFMAKSSLSKLLCLK